MDILTEDEIGIIVKNSAIAEYYNEEINKESAAEILQEKMKMAEEAEENNKKPTSGRAEKNTIEKVLDNSVTRQIGRTVFREITRGILGKFGIKMPTTRRKKTGRF
jgi:hypothetical protein